MERGGTHDHPDTQLDITLDAIVFKELASRILAERASRPAPHAGARAITLIGTRSGEGVQSCPHETDT